MYSYKVALAGAVALATLCYLGWISYRQAIAVEETQRGVRESYEVISGIQEVNRYLSDSTRTRGEFVYAGDVHAHENFEAACKHLDQSVTDLRTLTADNSQQKKQIDELQAGIVNRTALLRESMRLGSKTAQEQARQNALTIQSLHLLEVIQEITAEMTHDEKALLRSRQLEAAAISRRGSHLIVAGYSLVVTLVLFVMVLIARDEAARARTQQEEQKFRRLLESAPDAMVIANAEGAIVLTNAQAEKLFGYTREELIGQPVEMLVPSRCREPYARHRAYYSNESMGSGLELAGQRKDGTEFPIEISLSPIETPEGTLVSSAIRDISERRAAAEALRLSEERLQMAVDAAQLGIWDLDLATDRVFRSLRHDQIFGFESLQPEWGVEIGMTHIVPEDRGMVRKSMAEALNAGRLSVECRIRRAGDGSLRWISAQGRVYGNATGKPARMMGVVADITQRKQAEQELESRRQELSRSNAELSHLNRELESFSYSVSHDLRAPLRHIDGFARILKEEYAKELSPEAQRYLDRVLQGANHMGQLVDDLLNLARIGRKEMVLEATKLGDLAGQAWAEVGQAEGRRIEWRMAPLPEVKCDPGLLKLVFSNLLSNAVKFTRNREPAVIEVGACEIQGVTAFFVRDNGVGFDKKYADKLFGVFQRLHRQEDFEGTGVGLATVQRIVHRHGGDIWAESAPDQGATFFFTLGARRQRAAARQNEELALGRV